VNSITYSLEQRQRKGLITEGDREFADSKRLQRFATPKLHVMAARRILTNSSSDSTTSSLPPVTTMSDDITLWCNVKGDSTLIFVEISPEQTVAHLKELIHRKRGNNVLSGLDAADLVLYKVRRPLDTLQ
jgi:hypothetical protein